MLTCKSLYLGFVLFAVSCNLMEPRTSSASEHLRFPEKDLEEIVVWGYYRPENPHRLDSFRQEVIRQGRLKPGEVFEEKYEHLLDSLNENYYYTEMRYCYYRKYDKERVFKDSFRIRLYDKNGRLLAEDYLRLIAEKEDSVSFAAYLPYHNAGHEIRIVRLEGKEEVLLEKLKFNPRSELMQISTLYDRIYRTGWTFDGESQCFVAPPL